MTATLPYHVLHVYLDKQLTQPALDTQQHGNYLVFWWKDIALGHLFIEAGRKLPEQAYYNELIQAVDPAITHYSRLRQTVAADWADWIRQQHFEEWSRWVETIFNTGSPHSYPASLPVSIVICTRNRAVQLRRCLQMLLKLTSQPAEIIVVDNAPDDDSSEEVAKQFNEVVYVREPRPGLDIARNTGIKQAQFPIVAFTDDDVEVHHQWVYQVWKAFEEPTTAAMTGLVIASELQTEAQLLFEKFWSFNRGFVDKCFGSDFINETLRSGPPVWRIGAGANMAFRKKIFEEVGFFNELLDVGAAGCNGDSEMWYRVLLHGHTIHYNPRAIVFHEHRKELKGLKKQIFYYMRGHAVAALIQQNQHQKAGYSRYLLKLFVKSYPLSIIRGFPGYKAKYSTLWAQISGAVSGLAFYFRNRERTTTAITK